MGGKHKQAQRTKNNARPSSSGRSAELLSTNVPSFSGFSGGKETGFVLPSFSLATSDELDSSIDTNFQLVFKKMNKKDSTTKLKALQEFSELVKNSDAEAVKAILLFWPKIYNVLATDTEHRVREAAQIAHNEVVSKAKRNIAPYLKQLIAPWFVSQYDTYPPAASAAMSAFNSAFPENKVEEAIIFCQREILAYISDNLLVHNAQTVASQKTITPEDSEAKYERILISSLLGYSLYLKKIPKVQIEQSLEIHEKIVRDNKFWKYAKHKVGQVRSGWYEVLIALFEKGLFLLQDQRAHVTKTVLGSLDESEPIVLPRVWQAALWTITTIEEWWISINLEKVMFSKLWRVLSRGGQGNAAVVYPNLLPLLSNLTMIVEAHTFYNNFFENLRLGMKEKSVIASKSESVAVATALIECLQFVILKHQSDVTLCEKLIKSHLIQTLEWCLLEAHSCYKTVFNQTSSLLQYWSRNRSDGDFSNYSRYLDYFWNNLNSLFQGILLNLEQSFDNDAISEVSNRQIELLLSLKHTAKRKRSMKVTFAPQNVEVDAASQKESNVVHNDVIYTSALNNLVYKTCESYLRFIDERKSKELLGHLFSLVQDFDEESFFVHLSERMDKNATDKKLIVVFDNLLVLWLKCDDLCSKSLIDLIFLLFKHLDYQDKEAVLRSIQEISNENYLSWCIAEALSHPHNKDELILEWLLSPKVTDFLVGIVEKEIADECSADLSALLKLAVTENQNGDILVSKEAIIKITDKLKVPLLNPDSYTLTLDACASLASYLSAIIYTESLLLSYPDDLLLALFNLSCNTKIDPETLSKDTLWEVQTAWQDAFVVLSKNLYKTDFDKLLNKVIDEFEQVYRAGNFDDSNLDTLIDVIANIIRALHKSIPLKIDEIATLIFNRDFIADWKWRIVKVCKTAEYVKGNLTSPYETLDWGTGNLNDADILKYFVWSYLKVSVITRDLEDNGHEEVMCKSVDDDDDEVEENVCKTKIWRIVSCEEVFGELVYDLGLSLTFVKNYKMTKSAKKIKQYYDLITKRLVEALETLPNDTKSELKSRLKTKTYEDCWIWCKAIHNVYTTVLPSLLPEVYEEFVRDVPQTDKLTNLQMTQIFGEHLNFDYVPHDCDTVGSIVVLRSTLHCRELDVQIAEVLGKCETFRSKNVSRFLCDSDNIDWEPFQIVLETVRLCAGLVEHQFDVLPRRYLDLILISLTSWSKNSSKQCDKPERQALIVAVLRLFSNILNKVKEFNAANTNSSFTSEWEELFSQAIHCNILKLWLHLTEQMISKQGDLVINDMPLLEELVAVIASFDHVYIFSKNDGTLPKWTKFVKRCCLLLSSPVTLMQLAGYKMLQVLVPGLVEIDSVAVNTNTPHEKGLIFEQFKEILLKTHDIVNNMLLEFKLGEDSCRVEPFTDSFTYTFAYLLVWDILLSLCENSSTELRYQYADWLRNEDLLKYLFNNLFRLMPTEILHYSEGLKLYCPEWFVAKTTLNSSDICTSGTLEHMVCWVYALTLSQLPALVRQWWSGTDTRIGQIVEKITSAYVSPHLCSQELSDVAHHETKFKNMTIKVMQSVREVVAVYTVDEAQMELVIALPVNYPLTGPEVHCNRQIGGTSHKQWLMQLKKCVLHQNGKIWDGLSLWNNNLDKKFDGVEECYICFAVLHPGTYQLPKLSCHTCRKKFHSACLYKWFSTSNKSSCPICRNLF